MRDAAPAIFCSTRLNCEPQLDQHTALARSLFECHIAERRGRRQVVESDRPVVFDIAATWGDHPEQSAKVAACGHIRSPSVWEFPGCHGPRCRGISASISAWSDLRAASVELGWSQTSSSMVKTWLSMAHISFSGAMDARPVSATMTLNKPLSGSNASLTRVPITLSGCSAGTKASSLQLATVTAPLASVRSAHRLHSLMSMNKISATTIAQMTFTRGRNSAVC